MGLNAIANLLVKYESQAQNMVLSYLENSDELKESDLPALEKIKEKFFSSGSSADKNIKKLNKYIDGIKRKVPDESGLDAKSTAVFKKNFGASQTRDSEILNLNKSKYEKMVLDLSKKFPLAEYSENSKKYVVNKKGFAESNSYGSQEVWGKMMHQTVQMGKHLIEKENISFDELIGFFASRRSQIAAVQAEMQNKDPPGGFGVVRVEGSISQCGDAYGELGEFMIQQETKKIELLQVDEHHKSTIHVGDMELETVEFWKAPESTSRTGLGNIIKTYPKSMYPSYSLSLSLSWVPSKNIYVCLHHTPAKNAKVIMEKIVRPIFEKAVKFDLKSENDIKKLDGMVSQIYWWICRAKPWNRGDPSIAEMLIKSIYFLHGVEMPSWRKGVIPWAEAMKKFTPDDFEKVFNDLFEVVNTSDKSRLGSLSKNNLKQEERLRVFTSSTIKTLINDILKDKEIARIAKKKFEHDARGVMKLKVDGIEFVMSKVEPELRMKLEEYIKTNQYQGKVDEIIESLHIPPEVWTGWIARALNLVDTR